MDKNELMHFGKKGMKWGVRRYQNKDGTLTKAGQRRYDYEVETNNKRKKDKRLPQEALKDPNRWIKETDSKVKGVVDASSRLSNDLRNANRESMNRSSKKKYRMDLSNMSDKEMRDQINRAMLEKQYNDMFSPQTVSKGRERVTNLLEIGGSALAVTSSALGIAIAIRELKGG